MFHGDALVSESVVDMQVHVEVSFGIATVLDGVDDEELVVAGLPFDVAIGISFDDFVLQFEAEGQSYLAIDGPVGVGLAVGMEFEAGAFHRPIAKGFVVSGDIHILSHVRFGDDIEVDGDFGPVGELAQSGEEFICGGLVGGLLVFVFAQVAQEVGEVAHACGVVVELL